MVQLENFKKMGSIQDVIAMIPGLESKMKGMVIDDRQLAINKAIIQSMTREERLNPDIIKASRRQRIAKGSGTTVQQVNQLIKQFEQSKELMRQMKNRKGFGFKGLF